MDSGQGRLIASQSSFDFKFGFVGATHRNNVGRDDLGTPWQESQCSQFAQRLEGAQILVYVDLWVNLLYNPTIAKMAR